MRLIFATLAAFGFMTGVALADPMASFYENTVKVTAADGTERSVLINADGSYSQVMGDATLDGTWEIAGEEACFSSAATAETGPYCVAAVERAVGDTWDLTAPDGSAESATLVAGR